MSEFRLQFPIRPQWNGIIMLTQGFGENRNDFYRQLGLTGHNGLDFSVMHYERGEAPVYASHDGYVISDATTQSDTAGRFVRIETETIIDGRECKVQTVYFHLKSCRVSTSDDLKDRKYFDRYHQIDEKNWGKHFVKAGQEIGISDNTGRYTTGSHLHFGMYIFWKRADGTYTKDVSNGYDGAVNPIPYFIDDMVYQLPITPWASNYWCNGKLIDRAEIDNYIPEHLKTETDNYLNTMRAMKTFIASLKTRIGL